MTGFFLLVTIKQTDRSFVIRILNTVKMEYLSKKRRDRKRVLSHI